MLPLTRRPPLRILMSVDAIGGVWRYAMTLGRALHAHGVKVIFAGFGPDPDAAQADEARGIGTLVWTGAPLDWTVNDASALTGTADAIRVLAAKHRADLVHLNLPSQAASLNLPQPVIVVSHSCVTSWFRAVQDRDLPTEWAWQAELNRDGFRHADAVVAPSRSHAQLLQACYRDLQHVDVVLNAAEKAAATSARDPVIYAAGRWWDDGKDAATLDAAAARCDWPVEAIGSTCGPDGQQFGFHHVHRRGQLPHTEVCTLAGRAALFVSPSVYEPFGLAALEAALAGTALVLSDIPTYRELWDGAALFAAPRRPEDFADQLNRLSKDPALRAEMADRAHSRAAQFTTDRQALSMLELYEALLARANQLQEA